MRGAGGRSLWALAAALVVASCRGGTVEDGPEPLATTRLAHAAPAATGADFEPPTARSTPVPPHGHPAFPPETPPDVLDQPDLDDPPDAGATPLPPKSKHPKGTAL